MSSLSQNFRLVCQVLARLQTAIVDEGTERGPLSCRLDAALRESWAKWTPSDEDPTVNLKAPGGERRDYVLPTIHSNGSNPESLRNDYTAARNAVEEAIRAIGRVDLNARDYYPQGNGAYKKAQEQMVDQLQHLSTVRDELSKLEMHCDSFTRFGKPSLGS